jgi:hypothetical protein
MTGAAFSHAGQEAVSKSPFFDSNVRFSGRAAVVELCIQQNLPLL